MKQHHCEICDTAFYVDNVAWGDRTCGDCIAATIALSLDGLGARKPARRAEPADQQRPVVTDEHRTARR